VKTELLSLSIGALPNSYVAELILEGHRTTVQYRYEESGGVAGLTSVPQMTTFEVGLAAKHIANAVFAFHEATIRIRSNA